MSDSKPQIGGRVPQERADRFETYKEELNQTQTDALNDLLEAGLNAKTNENLTKTAIRDWLSDVATSIGATAPLLALWMWAAVARADLALAFAAITILANILAILIRAFT
jgi:hypothetical protein